MPDNENAKRETSPEEMEELNELRALDKRTLSVNLDKKVAGIIVLFFLGGGSYTGIQFVTESQLDAAISDSKTEHSQKIESVETEVKKNRTELTGLTATIGEVQETQHRDIAHREARRVVTENINCNRTDNGCQRRRASTLERIRRLNMRRLKTSEPVCFNLTCE